MPFGDRTGPAGQGPRTGRGAGFCAGSGKPDFYNRGTGRGFAGRGRGQGRRNRFRGSGPVGSRRGAFAVSGPGDELSQLKNQAATLKSVLEKVRQRIVSLESQSEPQ